MAETTPNGIIVTGAPTDVKASAQLPGTRDVLENIYNDFLDAKQEMKLPLDCKFDTWISNAISVMESRRKEEIFQQYSMGQLGKAEYEALEEYRVKLIALLKKCDPSYYNFDQFGIQYIQADQRHLFKERVGPQELLVPDHRPVHIKTSNKSGIVG